MRRHHHFAVYIAYRMQSSAITAHLLAAKYNLTCSTLRALPTGRPIHYSCRSALTAADVTARMAEIEENIMHCHCFANVGRA